MSSLQFAVIGAGALAAIAATASANVTATYLGTGFGKFQSVSYNASTQWDQAGSGPFYSSRAFDHHWTDTSNNTPFTAWCIQLYQGLTVGSTYNFTCVAVENAPTAPPAPGPMGIVPANIMRDLFARWADAGTGTIVPEGTLAASNAKAAAFAILIWEISHENFTGLTETVVKTQMSLTAGALRANVAADVSGWYTTMYNSLGVNGWLTSDLQGLVNSASQDQVRIVPAPGVLALLGLAGLAGARRRR
ncbi:MAG: MYXO-CTERM sorting domain-containing protein [Phycisphaerae bacterium]|nr:MYXO-CTERM sorting domain-containing protein [Phycisphaerae bacterium]